MFHSNNKRLTVYLFNFYQKYISAYTKKTLTCVASVFFSLFILYVDTIYSFPSRLTMHCGENHSNSLGIGVSLKADGIEENSGIITPRTVGEYDGVLRVAQVIPYKRVKINVTPQKSIFASGELIGLRIYNKGLIVLRTSEIHTSTAAFSPAHNAGIKSGDVIVSINGKLPKSSDDITNLKPNKKTEIQFVRNNKCYTTYVYPQCETGESTPKIGVWVRDSTAGVGTMTFFDDATLSYGALGHGISDSDTGVLFNVLKGTAEKSSVVSVTKGEKGSPGEICGSFANDIIGTVGTNCECGIFGKITNPNGCSGKKYPIGLISQVKPGDATILCATDGSVREYNIKILRSMPYASSTKGLMIEITDDRLLKQTGGIIQGMSGSPIIQNGRLIGAVTHVLVNDPACGYGIFIENMLKAAEIN